MDERDEGGRVTVAEDASDKGTTSFVNTRHDRVDSVVGCLGLTGEKTTKAVNSDDDIYGEVVSGIDSKKGWCESHRISEKEADNPLGDESENYGNSKLNWVFLFRGLTWIHKCHVVALVGKRYDHEESAKSHYKHHEALLGLRSKPLEANT